MHELLLDISSGWLKTEVNEGFHDPILGQLTILRNSCSEFWLMWISCFFDRSVFTVIRLDILQQ